MLAFFMTFSGISKRAEQIWHRMHKFCDIINRPEDHKEKFRLN